MHTSSLSQVSNFFLSSIASVVFDSIRRGHHQRRRRRRCDQLRLHHCRRLWYNKSLRFINYPCTLIGGGCGGLTVVVAGSAEGGEGGEGGHAAPCHEINFPDGKGSASMHSRLHALSRPFFIF